ncbi:MAG: NAD-dependent epimerase/dehydratase family protein [Geobacter sp.]|nr:MAG: NAD-dependent epimerase/dehydratase family protein [Geobacter sp.]
MRSTSTTSDHACPGKSLPQDDLSHVFDTLGPLWEKFRGKRIFITGGTGFFGKWLLETLLYANHRLKLGCQVSVLSRKPAEFICYYPHLSDPAVVQIIEGDIRDFAYPEGEYNFIVHAATEVVDPKSAIETFSSCIDGTKRVLEFARRSGCSDLLLVSSGAVYGKQPENLAAIPESCHGGPDSLDLKSAYGLGKRSAEWLASAFGEEHCVSVKIARCFAFVGPHLPLDKHFAIGNFIRDALSDRPIVIKGDGTAFRSYLYTSDLAIWLWTILLKAPGGVAYNVGGAEAVSIAGLARRVTQIVGTSKEITVITPSDPYKAAERYIPDVQKAEHELGLKVWIPLDEAIRKTVQWLK